MEQAVTNLKHQDWSVRARAIRELGELRVGDPQVVAALSHALGHDANARVRQEAAEALGKILSPEGVSSLLEALEDSDWGVRNSAVWALGELRDPRSVQPLISILGDLDWRARGKAAGALGAIRDPRAVEPLIGALEDRNAAVRANAQQSLASITGKHFWFGSSRPARWRRWWQGHKSRLQQPGEQPQA